MKETNSIKENNNVNNNGNKLEIPKELKSPDYALNITSLQDFSDSARNKIDSKKKKLMKNPAVAFLLYLLFSILLLSLLLYLLL